MNDIEFSNITLHCEPLSVLPSIVDLKAKLALIQIAGQDAKTFLQGQLTCDVNDITDNQSRHGAHCNIKGRMVSLGILFKLDDDFGFLIPKSMIDITISHFKKYALFSKVNLTMNEDYFIYGDIGETILINENMIKVDVSQNQNLILSKNKIENATDDSNQWHLALIQNHIPVVLPQTSEHFIPQMVGLEKINGVSFTKGCFLGQEIIARTQHLGKLKRHMHLIKSQSELNAGDVIKKEGGEFGEVVIAAQSDGGYFALAVLKDTAV